MASRKAFLSRNLEDVDVAGVDDNDSLVWDSGENKWKPVSISGGGSGVTDFIDLGDVPASYATFSGYFVKVSDVEDALEFASAVGGVTVFLGLTDTPADYSGDGLKFVKVNGNEDALEFVTVVIPDDFTDLTDTPANYTAASGKYLRVNDDEDAVIFDTVTGGAGAFIDLSDVPSSYSGEGGKVVQVNSGEDGLEFATGGGGGGLLAAFRAQLDGNYNITDDWNWEKLPFSVEDFETGSYYDETTNYRWTPPAGICHISVITDWVNVNTGNVWVAIYKNNTGIAHGRINRYDQSVSADIWDECNGTDYYEIFVNMGSFSSADILDNIGTKFSGAVFTAP